MKTLSTLNTGGLLISDVHCFFKYKSTAENFYRRLYSDERFTTIKISINAISVTFRYYDIGSYLHRFNKNANAD